MSSISRWATNDLSTMWSPAKKSLLPTITEELAAEASWKTELPAKTGWSLTETTSRISIATIQTLQAEGFTLCGTTNAMSIRSKPARTFNQPKSLDGSPPNEYTFSCGDRCEMMYLWTNCPHYVGLCAKYQRTINLSIHISYLLIKHMNDRYMAMLYVQPMISLKDNLLVRVSRIETLSEFGYYWTIASLLYSG